jgi:hypothetical protein
VRALGSEYVAVRYRNRYAGTEESPPWRIIGAANGTVLSWDPAPPAGAPSTLSLGEVTEFETNGPFVVKSQDESHPFYVSAHMTGTDRLGLGLGGHRRAGAGLLHPVRELRVPGRRERHADQPGRDSPDGAVTRRPDSQANQGLSALT